MTDPAPEQRLTVEQAAEDSGPVLHLTGELDPHTAPALQSALKTALADDPKSLVLDLTELTFIDSSGLRVLIDAHKAIADLGGELVVRNPSSTAQRLLEITKLEDHFRIETPT